MNRQYTEWTYENLGMWVRVWEKCPVAVGYRILISEHYFSYPTTA